MSFLGPKIWNMLNSNIKAAANTASFTCSLKKEIIEKVQKWAILLIFADSWFICFSGTLMNTRNSNEHKSRFRSFLGHPCHLRCRISFFFFFFFWLRTMDLRKPRIRVAETLFFLYDGAWFTKKCREPNLLGWRKAWRWTQQNETTLQVSFSRAVRSHLK